MAKTKGVGSSVYAEPTKKGTSIGRKPITSSMNKSIRRSYKQYRGQGK